MPSSTIQKLQALRRGDLAGARELRLHGLSEFPREIFALADTLELLDLGGGALTALPEDMGRLHKLRVLFCSGNSFERLPAALGDCVSLSQIGFRGSGLREIPGEALPPLLRWLILTDNQIESLPAELGKRPLGELLDRCAPDPVDIAKLRELARACVQTLPSARPLMDEIVALLAPTG